MTLDYTDLCTSMLDKPTDALPCTTDNPAGTGDRCPAANDHAMTHTVAILGILPSDTQVQTKF